MKLAPSEKLQFAAERAVDWLRAYGAAAFVVGALFALLIWLTIAETTGPMTAELGEVIRIGVRPADGGERPVLTVRTKDGGTAQFFVPRSVANGCRLGSEIELVRGRYGVSVSERGCNWIEPRPSQRVG